MNIVIDASVALAWGFPDETSQYADSVLVALEGQQLLVPSVWALEITNAIAVAERRKRINPLEVSRFIELLEGLTINEDSFSLSKNISNVLPLAREYSLSAYDASYLAVAMRHNAPFATLDEKLRRAAHKVNIEILLEKQTHKSSAKKL